MYHPLYIICPRYWCALQEELLYMRAKGLSWKHIEEAEKAHERRKTAAYVLLLLASASLGCFLCVKVYTVGDTTTASDFFASTDKPGVLNFTHEWPSALPPGQAEVLAGPGGGSRSGSGFRSGSGGSSSAAFAPKNPIQPGHLRAGTEPAAPQRNKGGFGGFSTAATANVQASSDATVTPTEANSGRSADHDSH